MDTIDALLAELDAEAAITRRVLAAVPAERADWRPHPRSMSAGELARHVVGVLDWLVVTIGQDEFDLGSAVPPSLAGAHAEPTAAWEAALPVARAALAVCAAERLESPWTLKKDGQVLFTLPRFVVLRTFVFSHLVHHRGQLTVYLRMLGASVPAVYGPSADERF